MRAWNDDDWLSTVAAFDLAAVGGGSWRDALSGLAKATGSLSGQLVGIGSESACCFNWISDVDQDWVSELTRSGGSDPAVNPRIAKGLECAPLQVMTDADIVTSRERRRHPFYSGFVAVSDIPYICATPLVNSRASFVGVAVLRSGRQGEIDAAQRECFSSIAPHVLAAVRTQTVLEHQGARLLAGALEALSLTAFVCDGAGTVRALTPSAEALVHDGRLLGISSGRLHSRRAGEASQLDQALRRVAAGLSAPGEPLATTVFVRSADALPLVLDLIPLPSRLHSFGFEPRVLVLVRETRGNPSRTRALLQAACGLTAAEAEVAGLLNDGNSPEAVAAARGVSAGTVRAQIRTIYSKLGVRCQIELMARLRQLG